MGLGYWNHELETEIDQRKLLADQLACFFSLTKNMFTPNLLFFGIKMGNGCWNHEHGCWKNKVEIEKDQKKLSLSRGTHSPTDMMVFQSLLEMGHLPGHLHHLHFDE